MACHLLKIGKIASLTVGLSVVSNAAPPYSNDPAILDQLTELKPGESLVLSEVRVQCGDLTLHGVNRTGPGPRDYCNKMAYAPDRQTALYAGGNHMVPHRMNDVWEYHLGSHTWHLLYRPDGGNAGKHKAAYFLTSRTLVRDPDKKLTEKEQAQIEAYRVWWNEHVVFADGHLTTRNGGPIMPAHTWDAFCYDEPTGKLIWGMGANPAGQLTTYAYYTGRPLTELEAQTDTTYTPMWMFDPTEKKWSHYRTDQQRATLRGMGATMCSLPDLRKSIWYVAAQNVSPHAFEMWLFDAKADTWTELKPNGGTSISELATKQGIAPLSEQQAAYSPKHRKLVAVLKHDTFVYDVKANTWSKAVTDERIYAHDAHSVFAYDDRTDRFLLAFQPNGKGKKMSLAAFDPETNTWRLVTPNGPGIPEIKYGNYAGYYDTTHGVFVIQGRYSDKVWVFRGKK